MKQKIAGLSLALLSVIIATPLAAMHENRGKPISLKEYPFSPESLYLAKTKASRDREKAQAKLRLANTMKPGKNQKKASQKTAADRLPEKTASSYDIKPQLALMECFPNMVWRLMASLNPQRLEPHGITERKHGSCGTKQRSKSTPPRTEPAHSPLERRRPAALSQELFRSIGAKNSMLDD